jgi:hypothetical protein
MKPTFAVVRSRRQGRIGTVVAMIVASHLKLLKTRVPHTIPMMVMALPLVVIAFPVQILFGVGVNIVGGALNFFDRTDRNYVSCIAVARKVGVVNREVS